MTKLFSRIDLSPSAKLVLRVIVDFWNIDKKYSFPKQSTLADCCGLTRTCISKAVRELKEKKLITTERNQTYLKYILTETFFRCLNYSQEMCLKLTSRSEQQTHAYITNKIKDKYNSDSSISTTKELVKSYTEGETASPYDDFDCAISWLNSLRPSMFRHRFIQEQAKRVCDIWNLDLEEIKQRKDETK